MLAAPLRASGSGEYIAVHEEEMKQYGEDLHYISEVSSEFTSSVDNAVLLRE